jgi:hypothetical protein
MAISRHRRIHRHVPEVHVQQCFGFEHDAHIVGNGETADQQTAGS